MRLGLVLAVVILLAACASPPHRHSLIGDPSPIAGLPTVAPTEVPASTTSTEATTTTLPATTTTTTPAAAPPRPYAVGWVSVTLSRAGRTLPTMVFYPAIGANPGAEAENAPPLFHGWPLLVFAEGYNTTPLTYHDLIHHLASSGFVVAAPSFPFETAGGPLNENDLQNEPADISSVITDMLAANGRAGVLSGLIDPARVGLVGHSDGGEAVLGAAYLPGIADTRVGPVVAMSAKGFLNGGRLPATPRHELLVVQGTADTINPPADAEALYASASSAAPKAYLTLIGAGHLPPIAEANQWRPIVEATIVDWLDAWFGGPYAPGAAGRLGHDADIPGIAQIRLG